MKRALTGGLAAGLVGCSLIIGDIPVPDDDRIDASAIAGSWYVYGLTAESAVNALVTIDPDGRVDTASGDAPVQATVVDGTYTFDLAPHAGRVSGRFDAEAGVGVMTEAGGEGVATWVVMVRRPTVRNSLIDGRSVQLELSENGSPLGEIGRFEASDGDPGIYEQSWRYDLESALPWRRMTVVPETEDEPRWVVRSEESDDDWLLSRINDGAVGVHRAANGGARGPIVLWSDPLTARLPDQQLYCAGMVVEDGLARSRVRQGQLSNNGIIWSNGGRGPSITLGSIALLTGDGSFFDEIDTSILPDAAGRLFLLLPIVPGGDRDAEPTRGWGLALCLGLEGDVEPIPDAGLDMDLPDLGPDAEPPDAAIVDADMWPDAELPVDAGQVEPDLAIDAAPDAAPDQAVDAAVVDSEPPR